MFELLSTIKQPAPTCQSRYVKRKVAHLHNYVLYNFEAS